MEDQTEQTTAGPSQARTQPPSLPPTTPQNSAQAHNTAILIQQLHERHGWPKDANPNNVFSGAFFDTWPRLNDGALQRQILIYAVEKGFIATENLLRTFG